VLGHLIRLQARSALADFPAADRHAAAADRLSERYELPLVGVFTQWYRALRLAATTPTPAADVEAAYQAATTPLHDAGMPGLACGLLPLTLLCQRLRHAQPAQTDESTDWGPYEPWARLLVLPAQDRRSEAIAALHQFPDPPRDLLFEALWCLAARELAGAGSGLLTLGPASTHLHASPPLCHEPPRICARGV
jgi:hypothetical protein